MGNLFFEILVSYDMENNKARNKLLDKLKDLGLISIQKSVCWGRVNHAEYKLVSKLLSEYVNPEVDKAFVLKVDLSKQIQNNSIGYADFASFEEKDFEVF